MKRGARATLIAVIAAAATACGIAATTISTGTAVARQTESYVMCLTGHGQAMAARYEPKQCSLFIAPGAGVDEQGFENMNWKTWTPTEATAAGLNRQCGAGCSSSFTQITLLRPVHGCDGREVFSRIQFDGRKGTFKLYTGCRT